MNIGAMIRAARERAGLTQQELAGRLGWGQNRLSNYERNVRNIDALDLAAIAEALGQPLLPEWVSGAVTNSSQSEWGSADEPRPGYSPGVPLLTWPQLAARDLVPNQSTVPCPVPHGPRTFAVRVRGDSMLNPAGRPSFSDGDLLFVDPDRKPEHRSLVIVRRGESALFRQHLIDDQGVMLAALNPSWPDRLVPMGADAEILGVVVFGGYVP